MTDETKEPGIGGDDSKIEPEEAKEIVDELTDEKRELMADPDFLKLVLDQQIFSAESLRANVEDSSLEEEQRAYADTSC